MGRVLNVNAREKLHKTFQLGPGVCVSQFWSVLAVSRGKIRDFQNCCAFPLKCSSTAYGDISDLISLPSYFVNFFSSTLECCSEKVRQQLQLSASRLKTVFPLAVHLGDIVVMEENPRFYEMTPSSSFVGGVPCVTARGKLAQKLSIGPQRSCFWVLTCTVSLTWKDWRS